jgi:hypothetical protein
MRFNGEATIGEIDFDLAIESVAELCAGQRPLGMGGQSLTPVVASLGIDIGGHDTNPAALTWSGAILGQISSGLMGG